MLPTIRHFHCIRCFSHAALPLPWLLHAQSDGLPAATKCWSHQSVMTVANCLNNPSVMAANACWSHQSVACPALDCCDPTECGVNVVLLPTLNPACTRHTQNGLVFSRRGAPLGSPPRITTSSQPSPWRCWKKRLWLFSEPCFAASLGSGRWLGSPAHMPPDGTPPSQWQG